MSNASDPSTWTPAEETSTDIFNDESNLIAILLCGFGYGIAFTLYCMCARSFYAQLWRPEKRRQAAFMLTYISIVTLCGGLYFASSCRVVQLGYVDYRNYPGGPYAYTNVIFSSPDNVLGVVAYFLVNWFTDAMIVCGSCSAQFAALLTIPPQLWRVYILYSSKAYPRLVVAFPCLLYLASFCEL